MEKPRELNVVRVVRGERPGVRPAELDVRRYLRLVQRKRYSFVAALVLVTSLIVAVGYLIPNKYEATSMVLIERNYVNDVMKGIAVPASIDDRVKSVSTIMTSRTLVLKAIKELDLDLTRKTEDEVEKLVQSFQKATNITLDLNKSRRDVDMFTVSLKHGNPVIARDYVNALVRLYIEENLSSKRDETFGAKKFLVEQVAILKDKISGLEAEIAAMNSQIEADAARMKGFSENAPQKHLAALRKKLNDLLHQYTPQHPEVEKLQDEIVLLERQVKAHRRTQAAGAENNGSRKAQASADDTMQDDAGKKNDQAGNAPSSLTGKEQKVKALERDRDTYRKMYEEMLATLGKSEVSSRLEVQDKGGTFKVLEPAILPIRPVSPNRIIIIAFALVAGIGAGIGFVILMDNMDKSVKNVDTANTFGLPVLAVLPYVRLAHEVRWTKVKNFMLFAFTVIYLACVAALLTFEVVKVIS
jgi:uncharacterized protein involved in exopolysaccharide biosynthesis